MKAPDKIYINNYKGGDILVNQWHIKPTDNPDIISHAYIRKDALLEWAKDMVDEYERLLVGFPDNGSNWAKKRAFEELIDKLNSM